MVAGAFGTVYKATLDEVDSVAVKMLPSDQLRNDQLQAFLTEVRCSSCGDTTKEARAGCNPACCSCRCSSILLSRFHNAMPCAVILCEMGPHDALWHAASMV